jgi:GNAT superfamily N-acetyltransferase
VGIRPLTATDRPAVGRALALLSRRTCQQRFLGPVDPQGSGRLRDLTTVDGRDFFAWLALRLPGGEVLGLAQFVRAPTDPSVAEPALLVVDRFQGLGLGTVLFRLLGREAHRRGVRRFLATTLASNVAAVRLLVAAGGTLAADSPGVWAATVDLDGAPVDPQGGTRWNQPGLVRQLGLRRHNHDQGRHAMVDPAGCDQSHGADLGRAGRYRWLSAGQISQVPGAGVEQESAEEVAPHFQPPPCGGDGHGRPRPLSG